MAAKDATFAGAIPANYDRYLGNMFRPQADVVSRRLAGLRSGALLEVAAGTGIVTEALARCLPSEVAIVATDLNGPMLDAARRKSGLERVTMRQANALELPFPDDTFEAIVCQFGVMFFPDRSLGHAEARRVLKEGGRYLFSAWDRIEENPGTYAVEKALAKLFPENPPRFMSRTPHGYFDEDAIRADLRAGGFEACTIEHVATEWRAASARDPATGLCQGTPLRAEIETRDPAGLERATEAAEAALLAQFGPVPVMPTRALLIEARKT